MRIARPCYDKYRRCPGWAGPGTKFPRTRFPWKGDWCRNGYVDMPERWAWKWRTHRCNRCGTIVLPYVVRWLDPGWWRWQASWLRSPLRRRR